ncbi:MAG: multidrug effflux MFS transporter [Pelistega sp.]|nr:multidrug effflux MFS transporter [Pelistega sp.]
MKAPKAVPLWFLAILTLSGTLAIHIFVPVLPLVARDFHVNLQAVQLTISVYVIGLAIGQLLYGPLADSIGRRPVLLLGLLIYTLASIGAMLAPSIDILVIMRFFQALGGCSGLLLSRAIIQDTTTGSETTKKLSMLNMLVILGPSLAPLIGGILAELSGWRSIFTVLSALGLLNLVLILRYVHKKERKKDKAASSSVVQNYKKLISSPKFLLYTIGGGFSTTAVYAFLGVVAYVFVNRLNHSVQDVSLALILVMLGVWCGCVAASRMVDRISIEQMIFIGSLISFASAAVLLLCVLIDYVTAFSLIIPVMVYCFGAGITSPAALSKALSINPLVAGSASGIYGFTQMLVGALCTSLAGLGGDPTLAAAVVLIAACLIAQVSFKVAKAAQR